MVTKAGGLKNVIENIKETLSQHKAAFEGILVTAIVIGINQIVDAESFECPCLEEEDLNVACKSSFSNCPVRDRAAYGWLFIFAPAAILLCLGFAVNLSIWKQITGCCSNTERKKNWKRIYGNRFGGLRIRCRSICSSLGIALIGPLTWIVLSLIDGDFLACALTVLPYTFKNDTNPPQSCATTTVSLGKRRTNSIDFFMPFAFR